MEKVTRRKGREHNGGARGWGRDTSCEAERRLWGKYVGIEGAGGKDPDSDADSKGVRMHSVFMYMECCI